MKSFDPLPPPRDTGLSFSVDTCISRSVFKTLSTEVQLDYARFYGVRDAEFLATDQICDAIFTKAGWTPALDIDGHVRLPTPKGVIVAREVMDLVDWLVAHHSDTDIPALRLTSPKERDPQTELEAKTSKCLENLSRDNFEGMAEHLRDSQRRLQQSLEASRTAVRAACADFFILQARLEEENSCQAGIFSSVQKIVGVECMQEIRDQLDAKVENGQTPKTRRSLTPRSSSNIHPRYHIFTLPEGISGASRLATPEAHDGLVSGLRRRHDDGNDQDLEPLHRNKRRRFHEPTLPNLQTLLNYSSDVETDHTYSDSGGTERDFEDDHYFFFDYRGRGPSAELDSSASSVEEQFGILEQSSSKEGFASDKESKEQSTNEEPGKNSESHSHRPEKMIRWNDLLDFNEDSTDLDYQPPDWDMEDVWELETACRRARHPLFRWQYDDEIRRQGVMSDASLSTDDPDEGYRDRRTLYHPWTSGRHDLSSSLGNLVRRPPWDDIENYPLLENGIFEFIRPPKEFAIRRYRRALCLVVKERAEDGFRTPVDFEHRLDELLVSDHLQFCFDDEAWKFLAPPPVSPR